MFKNKILTIVFLAVLGLFSAQAQNKDSLTFIHADWTREKVAKGVEWKRFHFTGDEKIFAAEQMVNVVVIDQKKAKRRFAIAAKEGERSRTSDAALSAGAIVAINGSFYNTSAPYNSVCYLKIDDVVYFRDSKLGNRDRGTVLIDKKGRLGLDAGDPNDPRWRDRLPHPSMIGSGPMMVTGGETIDMGKDAFVTLRHPRTAVGTAGNKIFLVTVDGRSAGNSLGVNLYEFAAIMRWLGAEEALNLDGGGSTTLYIQGQPDNGVVNFPCDNQKFDHAGERRVSNSILLL